MNLNEITKIYNTKTEKIIAINNITYSFEKGKFYAITGASGSGKSTLINILGLMDTPTSGKYYINSKDTGSLTSTELSYIRMNNIGFVFQNYLLDPNLKAFENVILPMLINKKISKNNRKELAIKLLEKVGLEDRINHFPKELSGGEQQRVAIARALVNNPDYILCDEPTGNLDEENEKNILELLKELKNEGKCIIVVSHSKEIAKYANYILTLKGGTLTNNETN